MILLFIVKKGCCRHHMALQAVRTLTKQAYVTQLGHQSQMIGGNTQLLVEVVQISQQGSSNIQQLNLAS